ncbi:CPXCG motif-containing cysteine-rich protein [Granulosicoccaceae sp. 1_MG-2023]|nr:CPXCG motif-containing cysteine-rich protein [Granulosicoccaceae sp. 1_MG-2023]
MIEEALCNEIENVVIQCPYCWEEIDLAIDCSVDHQDYIEDCAVCCQPIDLRINTGDGYPKITAKREND